MDNQWLQRFQNVPTDRRPAVMWFWDDEILPEELTFQLEKLKEQGIYDIFVNVVWGTTLDYLSDAFFDLVRHAVGECKRLGLSYWIYDEFNWPSGVAGGKLLRDEPWTRAKSLVADRLELYPGRKAHAQYDGTFERAYTVYDHQVTDVTGDVRLSLCEEGFSVRYESRSPSSGALLVVRSRYQQSVLAANRWGKYSFDEPGYVDPFNPAAIRKFIEFTHEKYKQAVGDEFGKTVKGLFTDEVCVSSPFDIGRGMIPWNDELRDEFARRYGYALDDTLYALFITPRTPAERKCRYDFWKMLTALVRDAHIRQAYEWCGENNLLYTGHFCGEESLAWDMFQSGDIFTLMPWMHIPGIDSILSRDLIENENFNTAGKIGSSVARFYNRSRILCETYTGSSWKLRMDEMRRIANRLLALGVNMIQYMGAYYSIDGGRKQLPLCYPPSHHYQNPLFGCYGMFGDYVGRIQYISSVSHPDGRVLMLLPLAGVYEDIDVFTELFNYQREDFCIVNYEQAFIGTVNALLGLNIEFDLAGDSMADEIHVEDGAAALYGARYECVVLPLAGKTSAAVVALARKLASRGVRTVFIDELPMIVCDTAETVDLAAELGFAPDTGEGVFFGSASHVRLIRMRQKRQKDTAYRDAVCRAVGEEYRTLNAKHDGGVYVSRRTMNGSAVYFIVNDNTEPRSFSGTVPGEEQALVLDPETGKVGLIPAAFSLELKPLQFLILVSDADAAQALPPAAIAAAKEGCTEIVFRQDGYTLPGGNQLPASCMAAPGDVLERVADGASLDGFAPCSGIDIPGGMASLGETITAVWDFDVEDAETIAPALFAETEGLEKLYLNGTDILGRLSPCRLWGVQNAEAAVDDLLCSGTNRVALVFRIPDWAAPHTLPMLMLRGSFAVLDNRICELPETVGFKPLEEIGFPRFGGEFAYRIAFDAPEGKGRTVLSFQTRDAVELCVNGTPVGKILWAPYEMDITQHIKPGTNTATLTLLVPYANLMGETLSSGLRGLSVKHYPA